MEKQKRKAKNNKEIGDKKESSWLFIVLSF